MMRKVYQTNFEPGTGDCFAACVATVLRLHSIVGVTVAGGFEYVHDPNPAGGDIDGDPTYVLFFAALRPDRVKL